MKMKVVATITSYFDVDSNTTEHSIEIEDEDGLSEVSYDILGAVVLGGLRASQKAVVKKFPRLAALPSANSPISDEEY
jgi:hypothetical protein